MRSVIRKPSIKKSISSRTTGRATRTVHKTLNPTYGKKGIGYIKDSKKAVYNKVYNATSYSIEDIAKPYSPSSKYNSSKSSSISSYRTSSSSDTYTVTNHNISDFVSDYPYVVEVLRGYYRTRLSWGIISFIVALLFFYLCSPPLSFLIGILLICLAIHLIDKASQYHRAYEDAKSKRAEGNFR